MDHKKSIQMNNCEETQMIRIRNHFIKYPQFRLLLAEKRLEVIRKHRGLI